VQSSTSLKIKLLNWTFDILMFIVPIMEMTDLLAIVPPGYLPYYMLATVVLRRLLRILEEHLKKKEETNV